MHTSWTPGSERWVDIAEGDGDRDGKMAIEYDFTMAFIDFITCIRTKIKCWMPGYCALNERLLYACTCGRDIMWCDTIRGVFIISLNRPLLLFCVIIFIMTLTVFPVTIFNGHSLPLHMLQCALRCCCCRCVDHLHCTVDAKLCEWFNVKIVCFSDEYWKCSTLQIN